jgi:adenosine deaminase
MSADMQEAGNLFGCAAMLHVVERGVIPDAFRTDDLRKVPASDIVSVFMPIVMRGHADRDLLVCGDDGGLFDPITYPLPEGDDCVIAESGELYDAIERRKEKSSRLYTNFYESLAAAEKGSAFRELYFLHPDLIERLKKTRIGKSDINSLDVLALVRRLPKAELHFHLGGALFPREMIEVAEAERTRVERYCRENTLLREFVKAVAAAVQAEDLDALHGLVGCGKSLRTDVFDGVPEPIAISAFLLCFSGNGSLLERYIFGDKVACGIGINRYESQGDLQGSALLQSKKTISSAIRIMAARLKEDGVQYIEVRCSPQNYCRGDLSLDEVIDVIMDSFNATGLDYRLIIIVSRHRVSEQTADIVTHICQRRESDERFAFRCVGFDLAGDEAKGNPAQMRDIFLPAMRQCMRFTIHAGETADVENVWEAVYHLAADRIGHGLRLAERDDLIEKFKDSGIGIEMCPTSNDQIVGYSSDASIKYPLLRYLERGLAVTVNTDNTGISRTSLSEEFLRAASLCDDGLSWWEVLRLIRNSVAVSFVSYDARKRMMRDFEQAATRWCTEVFR